MYYKMWLIKLFWVLASKNNCATCWLNDVCIIRFEKNNSCFSIECTSFDIENSSKLHLWYFKLEIVYDSLKTSCFESGEVVSMSIIIVWWRSFGILVEVIKKHVDRYENVIWFIVEYSLYTFGQSS